MAKSMMTKAQVLSEHILDMREKHAQARSTDDHEQITYVIQCCEAMLDDPAVTLSDALAYIEHSRW